MGKQMREGKKARSHESLEKTPPNQKVRGKRVRVDRLAALTSANGAQEAKLMHDLFVGRAEIFKRNAPTPTDVVWMSDTVVNAGEPRSCRYNDCLELTRGGLAALMMHPQERNGTSWNRSYPAD